MLTQPVLKLAALLAAASAVSAAPSQKRQTDCTDVHIFLAKGWNEPYPGRMGKLAGAICWSLDSCDYEDIYYSNTPEDDYCASVTQGTASGLAQMTAYAERCPNSKLVLAGYSQGANVAGDILGGGGGSFGDQNCQIGQSPGLNPNTSPGNKLAAAMLFGDVRHVAGQPYNYLSGADFSSWNPRTEQSLQQMNQFSDRMRSFCVISDSVCAGNGPGPFVEDDHLNYFDRYSDEAGGWVRWRLTQ